MRRHLVGSVLIVAVVASSCAAFTVNVTGAQSQPLPSSASGAVRVDPFVEVSDLETRHQAIPVGKVTVTRTWQEKPFYAKRHILDSMERHVRKQLPMNEAVTVAPQDDVFLVQTTITDARALDTNALLQGMACGLGFVCPPLWIYNLWPVENNDQVRAVVQVFRLRRDEVERRERTITGVVGTVVDTAGLVAARSEEVDLRVHMSRGFLTDFFTFSSSVEERERRVWEPTAEALAAAIKGAVARASKGPKPPPPITTEAAPAKDAE